jgi:hypothetical protein
MSLQVALFETGPTGDCRLLGRTGEPQVVESVRAHIVESRIAAVRDLEVAAEAIESGGGVVR